MARMSTHPSRVPYPPGETSDFAALTAKAVVMVAEQVGGIHGFLLEMLADCEAPPLTTGAWEQRGASYKSLAAIGHRVGMTKAERVRWYRIAEAIPLSQRHAGLILSKDDSNPGTKERRREVAALTRTGLPQALEVLEAGVDVDMVGTSGFTSREAILSRDTGPQEAHLQG